MIIYTRSTFRVVCEPASPWTFSIPSVRELVEAECKGRACIVEPFAGLFESDDADEEAPASVAAR